MSAFSSAIFLTLLGIFACTVFILVKINQIADGMIDVGKQMRAWKGGP